VTVGELPASLQKIGKEYDNLLKGVQVQDLTPEIRKELNIPKQVNGVIVSNIEEGSAVEGILTRGDILLQINKHGIGSLNDYEKVASGVKSNENILLLIFRNGSTFYATVSAH
jgi:serine protease Do